MTSHVPTITNPKRIVIIDALRGFALAGIVFTHMLENFVAAPIPQKVAEAMSTGFVDQLAEGLVNFLFRGKFFALFSFLFGLSFFIQMDNASKRGSYFGWRFLWRLIILFVIGFVHSMFYRGDILTLYAFLGVFLIPFFHCGNRWILGFAVILFLGLGRYMVFFITQGENLFMQANLNPESPFFEAYFNLLKEGPFPKVAVSNGMEGNLMKAEFQFGIFSRGYLTFGFFLLGLYMGRLQFFKNYLTEKRFLKRLWIGSLVLLGVSVTGMSLIFANLGPEVDFKTWPALFGLTFYDLFNLALTTLMVAVFVLLYKRDAARRFLSKFAPYGRMALTNYFFQSIIGTFLFFGWGLGYIGQIPHRYVFLMALAIVITQMALSSWWLKHFANGPLEWLWRSLTFFKVYPLKRSDP
ncbi:MAG: DUF418 domain-containing protein [Bacteroidota bacterium]